MSWEILKFELRYHLRQPLFYILFVIFFFMTFGAVTSDAVQIGGALGNVNRNAPFVIMQLLLVMSIFGVLTTTAYVASAINRDFEFNTDSLFFSSPVKKRQYLFGRFTAAFIVSQPGLPRRGDGDHDRLVHAVAGQGAARRRSSLKPYVFSYFVLDPAEPLPLRGDLLRRRGADAQPHGHVHLRWSRSTSRYVVSRVSLRDLDSEKIGILLDPFGFSPFARTTRYWTVFEKNNNLLPLDGIFLGNRLLWIGVALVLLGLTFAFFKMEVGSGSAKKKKKTAAKDEALDPRRRGHPAGRAALRRHGLGAPVLHDHPRRDRRDPQEPAVHRHPAAGRAQHHRRRRLRRVRFSARASIRSRTRCSK